MAGNGVIVHRGYDPIQLEILGDLLRDNGIAASVVGTRSGAMVGVGQVIVEMHIRVPEHQAGAATDFLEAFFQQDGEQLLKEAGVFHAGDRPDEDPELGSDAEEPPVTGGLILRPLFALGFSLVLFNSGHLYSRRPWTALVIVGGQLWCIATLLNHDAWPEFVFAVSAMIVLWLCDAVGASAAAVAYNRGTRHSAPRQLGMGAIYLAAALAVGSLLSPLIPQPKLRQAVSVLQSGARLAA